MRLTNDLLALGIAIPEPITAADERRAEVEAFLRRDHVGPFCARLLTMKGADVPEALVIVGASEAARTALRAHNGDLMNSLDQADYLAVAAASADLFASLRPIVEATGRTLADAVAMIGVTPDGQSVNRLEGVGAARDAHRNASTTLDNVAIIVQTLLGAMPSAIQPPERGRAGGDLDRTR
jgi:hypothetical protein